MFKVPGFVLFVILLGIALISVRFFQNKIIENVNEDLAQNSGPTIAYSGDLVIDVIDGDTIKLGSGLTIRYIGINTPERGQPFYKEAKQFNVDLLKGKRVNMEVDDTEKDRNGRTLAYIYVDGNPEKNALGRMVNEEIVKAGYAVVETIEPNVAHQDRFVKAEQFARANCHGMWKTLCDRSVLGESASCITISDIKADAAGNDNENKNDEWIIINNSCNSNITLTNFLIKDRSASNSYKFSEFVLNSSSEVRIRSGCGQDSANDLFWNCPEVRNAIWNNDSDHAYLYNPAGLLVTDKGY